MKKIFSLFIALMAVMAINATDYYLVGSGSMGWSQNKAENKFVEVDGVLTVTVDDLYGDVKITEDGNWHPQWGANAAGDSLQLGVAYHLQKCDDSVSEENAPNLPVAVNDPMRYKNATLTLDASNPNDLVLTLVSATLYDHSAMPTVYCLVGGCTNNWDPKAAVEFVEVDGVLTANVEDLNGTFKIIKNHEWGFEYAAPTGTKINGNQPFTMSAGGDNISFANPFAGYKNAVLTLTEVTDNSAVLTLVSGTFSVFEADWYLPGNKLGWNIDETTKMTPVAGQENTYEFLAAEFGKDFKVVYGNWAVEFGAPKGEAEGEETKWAIGSPVALTTPCENLHCAAGDDVIYNDVTITIVVDYEAATVQLTITTEASALENTNATKAQKRIENGQLIIIQNGVRYNVLGAQL